MSIKAITSNANVLRTAHIRVRPTYMHKNSHLGAKYPPSLFVPVHSKMILCSVCDPAYALETKYKALNWSTWFLNTGVLYWTWTSLFFREIKYLCTNSGNKTYSLKPSTAPWWKRTPFGTGQMSSPEIKRACSLWKLCANKKKVVH